MEHSENTVILRGELLALPQFSHDNHHKQFYRFTLAVPRLSGTVLSATRRVSPCWSVP